LSGKPGMYDPIQREVQEANIRRALRQKLSDREVGAYAGVSARTVLRYRQAKRIPANIPQMGNHDRGVCDTVDEQAGAARAA